MNKSSSKSFKGHKHTLLAKIKTNPHRQLTTKKNKTRSQKFTTQQSLSSLPLSTSIHSSQFASFSSTIPTNPAMQRNINRPASGLYRDCLRLIDYMAGKSRKSDRLRDIIRGEFEKNANETDQQKVEQLKSCAVQGLANYLTIESLARAGNKFTAPGIVQDESLFNRRKQLQQSTNNLSLEQLQQIEMDGPQEYAGVSISGDFVSQGVDIGDIPKDDKPQFVKDLVDDKSKV